MELFRVKYSTKKGMKVKICTLKQIENLKRLGVTLMNVNYIGLQKKQ